MIVNQYEPSMRPEWDALVSSHPDASYGHSSATFDLAAVYGMQNRSLVGREGSRLIAILPLFLTEEKELRFFRLRTLLSGVFPAGPLFHSSCQGKAQRAALTELMEATARLGESIHADRVRINYSGIIGNMPAVTSLGYLPLRDFGYRESNMVGLYLNLNEEPETLRKRMRSGCRSSIKKAESLVQVREITDRDEWLACDELNRMTMGPLAYSRPVLEVIWDSFIAKQQATAFAGIVDGQILSVVVTIHGQTSSYYWMGWSRGRNNTGANHLLLWHAALAARSAGRRYFELGSKEFVNQKQIAIGEFKESFGGEPFYSIGGELTLRSVRAAALQLGRAVIDDVKVRRQMNQPEQQVTQPVTEQPQQRSASAE
jgi:hypothetical protein